MGRRNWSVFGDLRPEETLTIVVPIRAGHEPAVRALLDERPDDRERLGRVLSLHFGRMLILPPHAESGGPSLLVISTNYDPPRDAHMDALLDAFGDRLHELCQHCRGFSAEAEHVQALKAFLLRHDIPAAAFYVGHPWQTAEEIRAEERLRNDVDRHVDARAEERGWDGVSPAQVHDWLRTRTRATEPEPSAPRPRADTRPRLWALTILAATVLLATLPFWGVMAVLLRRRERIDAAQDGSLAEVSDEHLVDLREREDRILQNQLTHLVEVKPGFVRIFTACAVLRTIEVLARYYYNEGRLGGIPTIHFAKWIFVDDGRRLLFFSNYDGTWENYLGEFIDLASAGLTAVWSNTVGFPPARWLVGEGSRQEHRFKTWTRAHQCPTQFWHSSYRDISVRAILAHRQLRAGLANPRLSDEEVTAWTRTI